jgi:hypothetical protein
MTFKETKTQEFDELFRPEVGASVGEGMKYQIRRDFLSSALDEYREKVLAAVNETAAEWDGDSAHAFARHIRNEITNV